MRNSLRSSKAQSMFRFPQLQKKCLFKLDFQTSFQQCPHVAFCCYVSNLSDSLSFLMLSVCWRNHVICPIKYSIIWVYLSASSQYQLTFSLVFCMSCKLVVKSRGILMYFGKHTSQLALYGSFHTTSGSTHCLVVPLLRVRR